MRVLHYTGNKRFTWHDVPSLTLQDPDDALVEPVAASTCDLDRAIVAGAVPVQTPLAIGHECVARVTQLGSTEPGLAVGDLVVVPWHVSCGTCPPCTGGRPTLCATTPRYAMFGLPLGGEWGGMLSEQIRVPWARANLVRVPDEVDPTALASASDNLTDAYGEVAGLLAAQPGGPLLVVGGTSIGLWACGIGTALGAAVVYVDRSERRRGIAARYGATVCSGPGDLPDLGFREFPRTLDAAGKVEGLATALAATAPGGRCHSAGIYFEGANVPLGHMYMNAVTLTTGRADIRPHLPAVIDLVASGRLDPMPVFSETIAFDDLPSALPDLPSKPLVLRT